MTALNSLPLFYVSDIFSYVNEETKRIDWKEENISLILFWTI